MKNVDLIKLLLPLILVLGACKDNRIFFTDLDKSQRSTVIKELDERFGNSIDFSFVSNNKKRSVVFNGQKESMIAVSVESGLDPSGSQRPYLSVNGRIYYWDEVSREYWPGDFNERFYLSYVEIDKENRVQRLRWKTENGGESENVTLLMKRSNQNVVYTTDSGLAMLPHKLEDSSQTFVGRMFAAMDLLQDAFKRDSSKPKKPAL